MICPLFSRILACACFVAGFVPTGSLADPDKSRLEIGITIRLAEEWKASLTTTQRPFFQAMIEQSEFHLNDGIPYNRLIEMFDNKELDCVVLRVPAPLEGVITANEHVTFDLILYIRRGDDPEVRDSLLIGHLANLPPVSVPYGSRIEFYGMRSLEQGEKLLLEGRIDGLIAHDGRYKDEQGLIAAPIPPIVHVRLGLLCHDTDYARFLLGQFDQRVQTIRSAGGREGAISEPVESHSPVL